MFYTEQENNHLRYTDKGNNEHALKTGLKTGLKKVRKVDQYSINGEYIKTFSSIKDAMTELNVSYTTIWNAADGRTRNCQGYKLKFIE